MEVRIILSNQSVKYRIKVDGNGQGVSRERLGRGKPPPESFWDDNGNLIVVPSIMTHKELLKIFCKVFGHEPNENTMFYMYAWIQAETYKMGLANEMMRKQAEGRFGKDFWINKTLRNERR